MFFLKYIVNYLKRYYKVERGPEFVEALRRINHPSEVTVPDELIPSAVLIQLRGLLNLHALSINGDWVWPFWIEEQCNPRSASFIPRAMSLSYINLTHRNWTAVGVLGGTREAVVDPRGAVTPWLHGWSLDTWVSVGGRTWFPSRLPAGDVSQHLVTDGPEGGVQRLLPQVVTEYRAEGVAVGQCVWAFHHEERDYVVQEVHLGNTTDEGISTELVFSLRPYNPEGISLVKSLAYNTRGFWNTGSEMTVLFPERPARSIASSHRRGDVAHALRADGESEARCDVGLANAASVFPIDLAPGECATRYAVMPIDPVSARAVPFTRINPGFLELERERAREAWRDRLADGMELRLPDPRYAACFEACKAYLLLFNDGHEITAGPLTYHRHWFRDAAYLLNALGKLGYTAEVAEILRCTALKQWKNGYFCSQKGEWDSNGQAIWAILEHYRTTGDEVLLRELYPAIKRGVLWIEKKRQDVTFSRHKPRGLLPAGFSAEHLGPNDFYYWDNFWGLRGVIDGIQAAEALRHSADARLFESARRAYLRDLQEAISRDLEHGESHVLPAAPHRRPDAGMIGNICAAYPLALFSPDDTPWLRNTITFIRDHLFHDDGFYQHMIHSGVNTYLTLQMAQCLVSMGDMGAFRLMDYMIELASPTWCWPEAVNPRTLGGCMGDGHHGWAAADWVVLVRNLVLRENADCMEITRLVPAEWCRVGARIGATNAPTHFGAVSSVDVEFGDGTETLTLHAHWRRPPREIRWYLPASGRRVVYPDSKVTLAGNTVVIDPSVTRVTLEFDRTAAHGVSEGAVPGLEDIPPA